MFWARQLPLVGVLALVATFGTATAQVDDPFGGTTTEEIEDPFGDSFGGSDPFGESATRDADPFGGDGESPSDPNNPFDDNPPRRKTATVSAPATTARNTSKSNSPVTYSVDACSSKELRIRRALQLTTQLSFDGTTLAEAVEYLSSELRVPIFLDRKALAEQGIDPTSDTVDEFNISEVSFRTAIRLFLRDFDLKMLIRDDVLWITTTEVADETMFTRVYRRNSAWKATEEQILQAIHSVVTPESWDNLGGPGSIAVVGGGLVVRNAFHVHEEIDKLFAKFDRLYTKPADAPYGSG